MVTQVSHFHGGNTTVTILPTDLGKALRRVIVIHRFDSGNFYKEREEIVSEIAAEGMLAFYA